jgi:hypothetical protein
VCADYDPARAHGQLSWRLHDDVPIVEIANNWLCATFEDTYRSPVMSARLEQVLDMVQPQVVPVHNLCRSICLPQRARAASPSSQRCTTTRWSAHRADSGCTALNLTSAGRSTHRAAPSASSSRRSIPLGDARGIRG